MQAFLESFPSTFSPIAYGTLYTTAWPLVHPESEKYTKLHENISMHSNVFTNLSPCNAEIRCYVLVLTESCSPSCTVMFSNFWVRFFKDGVPPLPINFLNSLHLAVSRIFFLGCDKNSTFYIIKNIQLYFTNAVYSFICTIYKQWYTYIQICDIKK